MAITAERSLPVEAHTPTNPEGLIYARREMERALEGRDISPEAQSQAWLDSLRSDGPERDQATARLHELLLRAARFELGRRRAAMSYVRGEELEDIAMQAANDALMAVLSKLNDYRGASRFTTWAYKFALLEAGVKLRRRAWQHREVVLEPDARRALAGRREAGQSQVGTAEVLDRLGGAIASALTTHQRTVFVALALNEVPIDVLAERLQTSRGALYKTLHDARKRLRAEMGEER